MVSLGAHSFVELNLNGKNCSSAGDVGEMLHPTKAGCGTPIST